MGHFKSTRKSSLLLAPFAYREFARSSFNGSALERPSLAPRGYAVPLQLPVDAGRQRLFLLYRQDAWRRKYAFISDSSGMQLGGCCKVSRKPCEELQWGTLVALSVWKAPTLALAPPGTPENAGGSDTHAHIAGDNTNKGLLCDGGALA